MIKCPIVSLSELWSDTMPHADAASLPVEIKTKAEFWHHVHEQIAILLEGQRDWVRMVPSIVISRYLIFSPALCRSRT